MIRASALPALACLGLLVTTGTAIAQSIEGRVVTSEGEAVAGVRLELHRITAEAGSVADSGMSGASGEFSFRLPETSERTIFLVAAEHHGVTYFGPALHVREEGERGYEVTVYDTVAVTTRPPSIRVGMRHVVVTPAGNGFDVAEVYDIVGRVDRTLVPGDETVKLWAASLPEGATSVRIVEGGVGVDQLEISGDSVRFAGVLSPAGARVGLAYRLPRNDLRLSIEHPTDRVEVVVAGFAAAVEGAVHAETGNRSRQTFERYEAAALSPNDRLRIREITPGGVDRWVVIWIAAGALLLVAAAVLWLSDRWGPSLRT